MLRFAATPPVEVDAVSGATITSDAVKRGIRQMLGPEAPPAAAFAP